MSGIGTLILISAIMAAFFVGVTAISYVYNLNNIKSKTIGDGQHGTARFATADEQGGKLKNRVMMFLDEFGTIPKIESAEMMFSASRSRKVSIVAIIQSFAQLTKNYGKEGGEIITDNTQLTIFGGFAPNSESAETLSKAMGSRTVMSGSVSSATQLHW